jgi:hypothetical protein
VRDIDGSRDEGQQWSRHLVVAQARRGVQPHGGLLRLEQGRLAQRAHRAAQRRALINRALPLARDSGIVVGAGGGGGNGTSFESQRHGQS